MVKISQTYYVKDNIVFSKSTKEYEICLSLEDMKIHSDSKNHLVSNKILLLDLQKIRNVKNKKIELSLPIDKFEEKVKKIIEKKGSGKVPSSDDYDFIEKTSAIEVINGIIKNYDESDDSFFVDKVRAYINSNRPSEQQKITQLEEQIKIEKIKKERILQEKAEYVRNNISSYDREIQKLNLKIQKLDKEHEELSKLIDSGNEKDFSSEDEIQKIIEDLRRKIKNNEFEVKLLKAKVVSMKNQIKLGHNKHINWFWFILTLGLIYWTKYSDAKYQILRYEQKISKINEQDIIYEQKIYNLEESISMKNSDKSKKQKEVARQQEQVKVRIDEIEIEIEELTKQIKLNEKEKSSKEKYLESYDKDIKKIDDKLIELETLKEEFDKYSTKNIEKELNLIILRQKSAKDEIKQLRKQLESQRVDLKGEWIIEI